MTLNHARGGSRTFHFTVVRDQIFTSLMTYTAIVNTLGSYERQFGTSTYSVEGRVQVGKYDSVPLQNMFSGDGASSGTAAYIVAPVTALLGNDDEDVNIEGLEFTVTSSDEPKTATIERVWIDDPKPRPGRTVPLKVLLRTYRGEDLLRTIPISIPSNVSGTLALVVSDAPRLVQTEQREARLPQPRSVPQLIKALNKVRRNNTVYVRLLGSDQGAVVRGEVLSSLPPSVLAVLESDRSSGSFTPVNTTTLGEWELPTDHAVSGMRSLTIQLAAN
jgi:hypothetical protein